MYSVYMGPFLYVQAILLSYLTLCCRKELKKLLKSKIDLEIRCSVLFGVETYVSHIE